MLKEELKEVEILTLNNNGYESFDNWGNEVRSNLYLFLINEFRDKNINFFKGDNGNYIVYFMQGGNGGGMGGSPETMTVQKVNEYQK